MKKFCERCGQQYEGTKNSHICSNCRKPRRKKYSDEELLAYVREAANGKPLSEIDYNERVKNPNSTLLRGRFQANWPEVCFLAGVAPEIKNEEETQEEHKYLISHIAKEIKKSPSALNYFYQRNELPPPSGFTKAGKPFWLWNSISPWIEKYKSGEIHRTSKERIKEERIKEKKYQITDLARIIKVSPVSLYYHNNRGDLPNPSGFSNAEKPFWFWEAISDWVNDYKEGKIQLAHAQKQPTRQRYSDEEMLESIRKVAAEKGGAISSVDYFKSGQKPSVVTMLNRFHVDWKGLCSLAGVTAKTERERYSDDEINTILQQAAREIEGSFTLDAYRKTGLKPVGEYLIDRYGSWTEVCKRFGLKSSGYVRKTMDYIGTLKNTLTALGYVPNRQGFKGPPSVNTLKRVGYTYIKAVEAAGFDYNASREAGELIPRRLDQKERDRIRKEKLRQELIAAGKCPQCKGDWIEPRETHRGKPNHCRKCQDYYSNRYEKKKEQKG